LFVFVGAGLELLDKRGFLYRFGCCGGIVEVGFYCTVVVNVS